MKLIVTLAAACAAAALALPVHAQDQAPAAGDTPYMAPDTPAQPFAFPRASYDYVKRTVMIPMRDGVKLYTVIVIPKGARTRRSC